MSFGVGSADLEGKADLLLARHPEFNALVARHVRRDAVGPYRFALTAALFRRSGLPTLLMVTHGLGGGVRQQMNALIADVGERASFLELAATTRGIALSAPAHPDHPTLQLGDDRGDDVRAFLRSAAVSRVHIHHTLGMRLDLRALVHALAVPFDFTMHDYLTICPQINMVPQRDSQYCGAPEPAVCNACIAARPDMTAGDILAWRAEHAWLLRQADRVICPSSDTRDKLTRYGLDRRAVVVPHETVSKTSWPIRLPADRRGPTLRVAILGVLTSHKGSRTVAAVAEAADPTRLDIRLIGYSEVALPPVAEQRIQATGPYKSAELASLIAEARPHVIWFPGQVPETYSFTLSAAIATGLPIVASRIGALPERLEHRPLTWFADPSSDAAAWIELFDTVRQDLQARRAPPRARARVPVEDFYANSYLRPAKPPAPKSRATSGTIDLRLPGRTSVVVVPERLDGAAISPCGYIRLLLPLDHPAIGHPAIGHPAIGHPAIGPAIGAELDVTVATPDEALRYRADILACQRYSVTELAQADRLIEHCRSQDMRLLYDLDDDLLNIPPEHPDAAVLRPRVDAVSRMVRRADAVWVSTPALREALAGVRNDATLVRNGLDERLWSAIRPAETAPFGPLRVLFMGTATHDADLALVMPALQRLHEEHGARVRIDVLGITSASLPEWINRVRLPPTAAASYPQFVNWITQQHAWDVGIAPLVDTSFNRCKSAIKTMDYAGLGLAVLASDVEVYRGSIAECGGGRLVAENAASWFEAISRLLHDWSLLRRLREGARQGFAEHTLAAQADERREAWAGLTTMGVRRRAA